MQRYGGGRYRHILPMAKALNLKLWWWQAVYSRRTIRATRVVSGRRVEVRDNCARRIARCPFWKVDDLLPERLREIKALDDRITVAVIRS